MERILIVAGLHDSGPDHWQTWFETQLAGCERVRRRDWARPDLADWADTVARAVERKRGPAWLVAHSFGCLATVRAASEVGGLIEGALLVAPADPSRFDLADTLVNCRLPFPSLLVASRNDPWMSFKAAREWSWRWGSRLVDAGAAGHINAEAGFGPWHGGLHLLQRLKREVADARQNLVQGY